MSQMTNLHNVAYICLDNWEIRMKTLKIEK